MTVDRTTEPGREDPSSPVGEDVDAVAARAAALAEEAASRAESVAGDPATRTAHALRTVIPVLIGTAMALAYGLLGVSQWRGLASRSWDLGIFSQLARAYSELGAPIVPIKGDGVNLLGDHFHPLLVILGPIWAVWPSGLALLWTQAILFGISAVPLTRLAIDRLGPVLGTVSGLAYGFSFGLQSAADVQFHEIAVAVPLMALSLTALLRGQVGRAIIWGALLVFVKEDLGLAVAVLGGIIALREPRWRLHGAGLAAWGALWFVLSTFVILPLLNTAGQYDYTDNLGSPWAVLVPADKWITVLMLLLAAGLIGARSPLIWLMLPTLAWRFTGTVEFYWSWYWHYNAILMPVALAALLDALGDARTGRASAWLRTDVRRPGRWIRGVSVACTAAVTLVLGSQLPLTALAEPNALAPSARWDAAQTALDTLPDGTSVASDITLMAYAVPDHSVQWTHGPNERIPDCVLVDQAAFSWSGNPPQDYAQWAADTYQVTYQPLLDQQGFQVACRPEVL